MALWYCTRCAAAYAVGLAACPQCGGTDYQENTVPKINRQGPSYEPGKDPYAEPAPVQAEAAPQPAPPAEAAEPDAPADTEPDTPPLPPQHE